MADPSEREMIRALAAAGELTLTDEEIDQILPWFHDLQTGVRRLHEIAEGLPANVEPFPVCSWVLPGETRAANGPNG